VADVAALRGMWAPAEYVRGHNAAQIARYLEFVGPLIERGMVIPEEPNRRNKGSSRAPATDRALGIMWANRAVTPVLEPIIQGAKRSEAALGGVYFSDLLLETEEDPTAVQRFRDERDTTPPYSGPNGKRAKAFYGMCDLMAYALATKHDAPGGRYMLHVHTRLQREPDGTAEDPRRAGKGKARTHSARDSYRAMVADMERMVLSGTHTKEGAKKAKAEELGCSVWRVKDAIKFVNKERRTVFSGTKAA
jgi:hypothetical protein